MKIERILIFFVFLQFSIVGFAQKDFTHDAETAYKSEQYYAAIDLYKKAYAKEKDRETKIDIIYKIADCYRLIQDHAQAEVWFDKAIKAQHPNNKAQLYYAEVIKAQGRYDEALVEFNKYNAKNPGDPEGIEGVKSCQQGQKWQDNPTDYIVENVRLINSKSSDFSPVWSSKKFDEIIFTSTREGSYGNSIDTRVGENYSDLYSAKVDRKGKWGTPIAIEPPINSEQNEGGATFDSKYTNIYFTRCPSEKNQKLGCFIMSARKSGKGFDEPEKLEFAADSFVVAHPAMMPDGESMVFVANIPGGYGGKDLYYATFDKREKTWSEPVNLGSAINTADDEMFPFVKDNGDLCFASNGHEGMGGLDIFIAPKTGTFNWGKVENMRAPINSSSDDFGIIFEGNRDKGFFASNRAGGRGSDDIYFFKKPPVIFAIQGTVSDVDTKEPIVGASVKLIGTDGTSVELETDQTGFYIFADKDGSDERYVQEGTSYTIFVSKKGYLNSKGQETTVGIEKSTAFVHDFLLQSIKAKEISFPKVEYDLGSYKLRPASKDSLDFLYQTLVDNPNIVIELAAHTDARGSDESNDLLSQQRAQSCVDYLISKGIEAARMNAKGYGEHSPYSGNYNGQQVTLTEEYINGLPKNEQEAAHQTNRRTVFSVLRDDFVPANSGGNDGDTGTEGDQE